MTTDTYLSTIDRFVKRLGPINHLVDKVATHVLPNVTARANPYPICGGTGGFFVGCGSDSSCCWQGSNGWWYHGAWTELNQNGQNCWQCGGGSCAQTLCPGTGHPKCC